MPLGYRHFVVLGDDITPLSQQAFEALFREQRPGLPAFAGTTVDIVTVVYGVEHRRPTPWSAWIVSGGPSGTMGPWMHTTTRIGHG